ncbi:MAG: hypothetical protein Q8O88_04480 [bacterium]|nr:hypothetical protein [bacterium]
MNSKIIFNHEYYQNIIKEYSYDHVRLAEIDFGLGSMPKEEIRSRWICHCDANKFAGSDISKSIVTTGIGLSGVPHIGTLTQIFGAIKLQKAGLNVQIVLGDLDAYNGKNIPLEKTLDLAKKYRNFILKLGFIEDGKSLIRDQYSELEVIRTMYLAGNQMEDTDFDLTEEDLHSFYKGHGKIDKYMSFRRKLSLALMSADFIDLILRKKYENVLVMLGIDEHKYVLFAQKVMKKINKLGGYSGDISSIYSPVISGFNGYSKMSKSFPESSLKVEDSPEKVKSLIINNKIDSADPAYNAVFQMMTFVGNYTQGELVERKDAYLSDEKKWEKYKKEYIKVVIRINSLWNQK